VYMFACVVMHMSGKYELRGMGAWGPTIYRSQMREG